MENQFVIFTLAGERYGVAIGYVESIIKMQPITPVPHTPVFVEGVTNLRGQILPVLDLRQRLGLGAVAPDKHTRIMAVSLNAQTVGLKVDSVNAVLRIEAAVIEPPAPLVAPVNADFIQGIAKVDTGLVILLDLAKVLPVPALT